MASVFTTLVGKPVGERQRGRPTCGWEDTVKIDLRKIGLRGVDWIHLAPNRNRWPAFSNKAMSATQEGYCSMELFIYLY
jgi:hypothetical protein